MSAEVDEKAAWKASTLAGVWVIKWVGKWGVYLVASMVVYLVFSVVADSAGVWV